MAGHESLTATVHKTRFRKADTNWSILETNKGICKGVIEFEPAKGDVIQMEGKWERSKYSGQQEFSFKAAVLSVPTEPRALLHLAVSWTKGLGESREAEIWDCYGDQWPQSDLMGLKGLTDQTRWNWKDTIERLEREQAQTQAISFLLSKGCTLNMATVAWAQWEAKTVGLVTGDPYVLCDLPHYGFGNVDNGIRQNFGINDDDPRRLDAAVLYVIGQLTESGDTVVQWEDVSSSVADLVPYASERFEDSVKRLEGAGKVRQIDDGVWGQTLCRESDYQDEEAIWKRFAA